MVTLIILLNFTCSDGRIETKTITKDYPKQFEIAKQEFELYTGKIGTHKDFFGCDVCTLTEVRGKHTKQEKVGLNE
jgi:hypothetical protein